MRTSIVTSLVSGLLGLTLAACSGTNAEPVDQSAQAETAHLNATPPGVDGKPGAERHGRGRGPRDPAEMVKRFDKNGDGALQVAELPERMQKFVGKADTNADGVLSVDELKAAHDKMKAEHLAKIDTDHDGKVSPEERKAAFEQFAQKRFDKMDKNSDGALTKDEIGDKRWQRLSVADSDKNGSVTREEIKTAVASGALKFPHHGRHGHGPDADGGSHDGANAPAPADAPSGT